MDENILKVKQKAGMKRLYELAFMKKGLIICSAVFSVLSTLASFIPFIAIYYIIEELIKNISNINLINSGYMIRLGILAGGSAAGMILLNFIALMCSHLAAFKTQYKLKVDFTNHLASLPMGFHTENSSGKIRKVVDQNIESLEGFVAHSFPDLIGSFAAPVIALVLLFVFDWRMGIACFVPILFCYLIQVKFAGSKKAEENLKTYQSKLEDMNNSAVEYVRGMSIVKVFNQTIFSFRRFYDSIKSYGDFVMEYTKNYKAPMVLFMAVINNVYLFLLPVGIWLSGVGDYNNFALSFIFYIIFALALTGPFVKILYISQKGKQIADSIWRMDEMLNVPQLIKTNNPQTASNYNVEFNNVTFSYNTEDGAKKTIDKVSFTAKQGEVTALVGPSGGGKSTLASLIPRFYDIDGGSIKIGGVCIKDMGEEYLMSIVGFVFQDVFLFRQTVAENIAMGSKTATKESIIEAAKAAQCHEFIEKLPNGYDTLLKTKNIHLSGGEKQRIVIARALLKDSPIIVLDEATSFADPENEQKIQAALKNLIKNKTVIVIAHRLSTIKDADKIVVIDDGRIAGQGKHGALIESCRLYGTMWQQYQSAVGWSITAKGGQINA